jgi:alkylation response protein AidB-like acyl-CoA dehydrogenase
MRDALSHLIPARRPPMMANEPLVGPDYAVPAASRYFNYRKIAIYAGSNEIQRNILSKAVLGI